MRINPLLGALNFLNVGGKGAVAREDARAEKDGQNGRDQYTPQQQQNGENETPEQKKERMDAALQAFQEDPQTQASGISAMTEGTGPGLKIVVKDASGGVIRQFTGEEFLKLRESVGPNKPGRGKLLDQKL